MSNPEFHSCCTCGYTWRHGHNGNHICAEYLLKDLALYKSVADRAFNWHQVQGPAEVRELHNAVEILLTHLKTRNNK
jgi:hypothetical protein